MRGARRLLRDQGKLLVYCARSVLIPVKLKGTASAKIGAVGELKTGHCTPADVDGYRQDVANDERLLVEPDFRSR